MDSLINTGITDELANEVLANSRNNDRLKRWEEYLSSKKDFPSSVPVRETQIETVLTGSGETQNETREAERMPEQIGLSVDEKRGAVFLLAVITIIMMIVF